MSKSALMEAYLHLRDLGQSSPKSLNAVPVKILEVIKNFSKSESMAPPIRSSEALSKWRAAFRSGRYDDLTRSDIRDLYWEPEVATTDDFFRFLIAKNSNVRTNGLKGIVFVVASRWDEYRQSDKNLNRVLEWCRKLSTNSYLSEIQPYIFSTSGVSRLATELHTKKVTIQEIIDEVLGVAVAATPYGSDLLFEVAANYYDVAVSTNRQDRNWFYDQILRWLPKDKLMLSLGSIVKDGRIQLSEDIKEDFKQFILNHPNLGDPRLPGYEGNWDPKDPVTKSVIEWLSQSDIAFFFEWCYQNSNDHQGRKKFWQSYAHLVRGTRVVMTDEDRRRYFREVKNSKDKKINQNIIAYYDRQDGPATAFIMDFGMLKVVEFSEPNHACYFYDGRSKIAFNDRSVFWSLDKFSKYELKDRDKASEILSHTKNWEVNFANYLNKFGLGTKRTGYY
jgi:hypothetical protein